MPYELLADIVVGIHLAFILFVVFGGFLLLLHRRFIWLHLPAVLWAVLIELVGWACPLTPLENLLRRKSGAAGYGTGFIEHYIVPLIYPSTLSRGQQAVMGVFLLVLTVVIYSWVLGRPER